METITEQGVKQYGKKYSSEKRMPDEKHGICRLTTSMENLDFRWQCRKQMDTIICMQPVFDGTELIY